MAKKIRLPINREPELKVCMTKEDFKAFNFVEQSENVYERIDERAINFNGQQHVQQRRVKFKLYPDDNPLGTNVECYVDDDMILSGYWEDKKDFLKTFQI